MDALDEALSGVRRLWLQPERRRKFLALMGAPVELATVRTLQVIERSQSAETSVAEVACALSVDPSTASRLVHQAVTAGFVDRKPGVKDKRRARLALTASGRTLLSRARTLRRRWLSKATGQWSEGDVALLADLLVRLRRDLDEQEPE